jgi:plastocyanin
MQWPHTFGRWEAASCNVKKLYDIAPAHRIIACAGVFVFAIVLSACDKGAAVINHGSRAIVLGADTVQLPSGAQLHEIKVRATQSSDFEPAQITAKSSDVVRFTVADNRTHSLIITAPTEQSNAALESSSQRRSPPLVANGQAWIISLKGLPAGTYQISCGSHAGRATLVIQ